MQLLSVGPVHALPLIGMTPPIGEWLLSGPLDFINCLDLMTYIATPSKTYSFVSFTSIRSLVLFIFKIVHTTLPLIEMTPPIGEYQLSIATFIWSMMKMQT